ncbi:hypothetical protein BEWA_030970 [Theileria equi strain WA]|uniref:C2H2-type domain-containing protein n=1 Tax=Theileria equi strain WA TaxID=1537102 RepID=L0AZB0_THEEQ|nr:hypothetical protein BEWA_030970 [Theileria equi strain WA]AFZ80244.1 hypothetical protein BEWA_030970 [Theileria equi strain WA]|eukprot:XP_004829910.1 hypothetical protein BEWA_030970 [Theileria equi strain WA]
MCGLFQPIGQVRLTNVATVRLKVKDQRFEIACYRNKVVNWRSGIETDIQEVLQCPYIFTSISKGKLAKNDQLIKAFNTTDIKIICKQILDKGEFQVSKEERNQLLESTFKDVVSILHEVAINPNTGHPLTHTILENALKSSGFSVSLNEPTKKQALKALTILQKRYPNDIARSQMRLRITCLSKQRSTVIEYLKSNSAYIEQDCASSNGDDVEKKHENVDIDPNSEKTTKSVHLEDQTISILFLCCPKLFRDIDGFVNNTLDPPGSLQLVSLNVKDAGNKGLSIQSNSLEGDEFNPPKEEKSLTDDHLVDDFESLNFKFVGTSAEKLEKPKLTCKEIFKCANCSLEFETNALYRKHCKSDFHVLNSKRKLKGMPPITEEEFQDIKSNVEIL